MVTLLFVFNFNHIYENLYPAIFLIDNLYPISYLKDGEMMILNSKDSFVLLLVNALYILILTVFFFNLGFLICLKILKNKTFFFSELSELNELKLLRVSFTFLLIKLFLLLINLKYKVDFSNLLNPLNLLVASVSFYLILNNKKNKTINFVIILSIFFENIFLTAGLYKNIILLIVLITIFYKIKKKFSFFLIISLITWVIFGQILKFPLRSYLNNQSTDNKVHFIDKVKNLNRSQVAILRPILLRSTEPIMSLMRIKEFEIVKNEVIKKDTISIIIYSLLPRVIYTNKPKQDFANWYTGHYFNKHSLNETTFNIFWPTDFYINKRYYGSIIISFIAGFLICFLVLFFSNFNSANISFLLGISILSGLTFPDYNISMMLSPIILQYLIFFLIIRILLIIDKKTILNS